MAVHNAVNKEKKMNEESKIINGAVKIGNGAKLHRAHKDEKGRLWIQCGCSGTRQGSAYHSARFFPNTTPTCKN
jgi:hypothetical protein